MKHLPPPALQKLVLTILEYIEWFGLLIISIATLIAIGQEVYVMVMVQTVKLQDILLLFIYLEILTMVGLYFTSGKLPLRYPIYIAIVAITRYITIAMKELSDSTIISLSLAILILALAVLVIRYGHLRLPYDE